MHYFIENIILYTKSTIKGAIITSINQAADHRIIFLAFLAFSLSHQLAVSINEPYTIQNAARIAKSIDIFLVQFVTVLESHSQTFASPPTSLVSLRQSSKFPINVQPSE
jgi:hypothetical protein